MAPPQSRAPRTQGAVEPAVARAPTRPPPFPTPGRSSGRCSARACDSMNRSPWSLLKTSSTAFAARGNGTPPRSAFAPSSGSANHPATRPRERLLLAHLVALPPPPLCRRRRRPPPRPPPQPLLLSPLLLRVAVAVAAAAAAASSRRGRSRSPRTRCYSRYTVAECGAGPRTGASLQRPRAPLPRRRPSLNRWW